MENGRIWISELAARDKWLSLRKEEIIWPELPIVDPHHHLWKRQNNSYQMTELISDICSGHNVKKTVYVECGAFYRDSGPNYLRSLGEVEYVQSIINTQEDDDVAGSRRFCISGIVSKIDLRLPNLNAIVREHVAKSGGNLKGVRHSAAFAKDSCPYSIPGHGPSGLYLDANYQSGARKLGELNLALDCWHYFSQSAEFIKFLNEVPNTKIVLNHLGMPVGIGSSRYKGRLFEDWKLVIEKISRFSNVFVKLGGVAMVDMGWGFHNRAEPIGSEEYAELIKPLMIHAIDTFGPDRCMFESNFPVDRVSLGYNVLWNAFKIICSDLEESAITTLFSGTAKSVYQL